MRKRRVFAVAAALPLAIAGMGIAHADNIQDDVIETDGEVITLVAGSATGATANIRVIGNSSQQDPDQNCNFDTASENIVVSFSTPQGVTVTDEPLVINQCGVDYPITLKAASNALSGDVTATYVNNTNGLFTNQVKIPVTVTQPNTKPTVTLTGVTNGAEYVIGSVPTAMCDVTDAEQPNEPDFAAALSGSLVNGLGQQTATCDFSDAGGLTADTKSATYSIVAPPNTKPTVNVTGVSDGRSYEFGTPLTAGCAVTDAEDGSSTVAPVISSNLAHGLGSVTVTCDATDTGGLDADTATATYYIVDTIDPTISHTVSGTKNGNGWYKTDVTVTFSCADVGSSGIDTCLADGETTSSKTLGEGENQSVTGTATDWGGNTASDTATDIDIDKTAPIDITFSGGPAATVFFGDSFTPPTCSATDVLSGMGTCVVTGGGSSVGQHTFTATATDLAGNTSTKDFDYTVQAWNLKGFYAPVDMGVWNTVKGGSTVPLKFEVFAAQEQTSTSAVKSFTQKTVACPGASAAVDEIEITSTGGTSLRYDTTGGQFVQNWQTPKKPGTCYTVTMTTQDDSKISANFLLK